MVGCWEYGSISYISIPKINLSLHQNEKQSTRKKREHGGDSGCLLKAYAEGQQSV